MQQINLIDNILCILGSLREYERSISLTIVPVQGNGDILYWNRLALSALRRLQKTPAIIRGFFRHPECAYAID